MERLLGDRDVDDDTLGFHAQQAAEKLLKAVGLNCRPSLHISIGLRRLAPYFDATKFHLKQAVTVAYGSLGCGLSVNSLNVFTKSGVSRTGNTLIPGCPCPCFLRGFRSNRPQILSPEVVPFKGGRSDGGPSWPLWSTDFRKI